MKRLYNGYEGEGGFQLAVGFGKIPGWQLFRKFGHNPGVPSSGSEEMWPYGTARVLPSAAAGASVVSSNAADASAGTGSRTLTIEGLDANLEPLSATVTMNGTTPVVTTEEFLRVHRVYNTTAGSNGINVGDISISVGGNVQAYIQTGEGQTQQSNYTVPAGYTLVVNGYTAGVGRMSGVSDCHIQTLIRLDGTDPAWRAISDIFLFNGGAIHQAHTNQPTFIPEKTEIKQIITSTSTTQAYSIFSGYLVENRFLH